MIDAVIVGDIGSPAGCVWEVLGGYRVERIAYCKDLVGNEEGYDG